MRRSRGGARLRIAGSTVAAAATLWLVSGVAEAATITPTPGFFGDDFTENDNCSLREAIAVANQDGSTTEDSCVGTPSGGDTVQLEAGDYVLTINGAGAIAQGDLDIVVGNTEGSLTIDGAGPGLTTISGEVLPAPWDDRILDSGGSPGTLTVRNLAIANGNTSGDGGGINANTPLVVDNVRLVTNTALTSGGGIRALGALTLTDSTVELNQAPAGAGAALGAGNAQIERTLVRNNTASSTAISGGGGILVPSTTPALTLRDSMIAENDAVDTSAGGSGNPSGGGLRLLRNATVLTVDRTTIAGNEVRQTGGAPGPAGGGGGLFVDATAGGGTVNLVNSTVSGNSAEDGGGLFVDSDAGGTTNVIHTTFGPNTNTDSGSAIRRQASTVNLRGSVIEKGSGGACSAAGGTGIASLGGNVFTDASCPVAPGDAIEAEPPLGALADNGGSDAGAIGAQAALSTHAPTPTSTVVDHVPAAACDDQTAGPPLLLVDQRGLPRPVERDGDSVAECDAGSVELQALGGGPGAAAGFCAGRRATRTGTAAGEVIVGTPRRDVIDARRGNDLVRGLGANDIVCGKAGRDRLLGGGGRDRLIGGRGRDKLIGGRGRDRCAGGPGRDAGKGCELRIGI